MKQDWLQIGNCLRMDHGYMGFYFTIFSTLTFEMFHYKV